jgi:hypothetical protein
MPSAAQLTSSMGCLQHAGAQIPQQFAAVVVWEKCQAGQELYSSLSHAARSHSYAHAPVSHAPGCHARQGTRYTVIHVLRAVSLHALGTSAHGTKLQLGQAATDGTLSCLETGKLKALAQRDTCAFIHTGASNCTARNLVILCRLYGQCGAMGAGAGTAPTGAPSPGRCSPPL